jgi:hypothetical protein
MPDIREKISLMVQNNASHEDIMKVINDFNGYSSGSSTGGGGSKSVKKKETNGKTKGTGEFSKNLYWKDGEDTYVELPGGKVIKTTQDISAYTDPKNLVEESVEEPIVKTPVEQADEPLIQDRGAPTKSQITADITWTENKERRIINHLKDEYAEYGFTYNTIDEWGPNDTIEIVNKQGRKFHLKTGGDNGPVSQNDLNKLHEWARKHVGKKAVLAETTKTNESFDDKDQVTGTDLDDVGETEVVAKLTEKLEKYGIVVEESSSGRDQVRVYAAATYAGQPLNQRKSKTFDVDTWSIKKGSERAEEINAFIRENFVADGREQNDAKTITLASTGEVVVEADFRKNAEDVKKENEARQLLTQEQYDNLVKPDGERSGGEDFVKDIINYTSALWGSAGNHITAEWETVKKYGLLNTGSSTHGEEAKAYQEEILMERGGTFQDEAARTFQEEKDRQKEQLKNFKGQFDQTKPEEYNKNSYVKSNTKYTEEEIEDKYNNLSNLAIESKDVNHIKKYILSNLNPEERKQAEEGLNALTKAELEAMTTEDLAKIIGFDNYVGGKKIDEKSMVIPGSSYSEILKLNNGDAVLAAEYIDYFNNSPYAENSRKKLEFYYDYKDGVYDDKSDIISFGTAAGEKSRDRIGVINNLKARSCRWILY